MPLNAVKLLPLLLQCIYFIFLELNYFTEKKYFCRTPLVFSYIILNLECFDCWLGNRNGIKPVKILHQQSTKGSTVEVPWRPGLICSDHWTKGKLISLVCAGWPKPRLDESDSSISATQREHAYCANHSNFPVLQSPFTPHFR